MADPPAAVSAPFARLPVPLLQHIAAFCPADARLALRSTNQVCRSSLSLPSLWRYVDLSPDSGVAPARRSQAVLGAALALAGAELESIDVSYCPGINHDALLAALQHRPALRLVRALWFARDGEEDGDYVSTAWCQQLFAQAPPQLVATVGLGADSLAQVVKVVQYCGGPARLSVRSLRLCGSGQHSAVQSHQLVNSGEESLQAALAAALPQLSQLHLDHCHNASHLLLYFLAGRVASLTALRLHKCWLTGLDTAQMLTCVSKAVTEVHINNDREDPFRATEAVEWWFRACWPPPNLLRLSLRGMDLWRTELGVSLVDRLVGHPNLTELDLSDNSLPVSLVHPQPPGLEALERLVAHNSPQLQRVTLLRSLVVTQPEEGPQGTDGALHGLTPLLRSLVTCNTHLRALTLDGVPPCAVRRAIEDAAAPSSCDGPSKPVPSRHLCVGLAASGPQRRRSAAYGEHWEPLEVRLDV